MKITKLYYVKANGDIIQVFKEPEHLAKLINEKHYFHNKTEAVKEANLLKRILI